MIASDEWYRELIKYKVTNMFIEGENAVISGAYSKAIKIRAKRFVVLEIDPPKLGYRERNR